MFKYSELLNNKLLHMFVQILCFSLYFFRDNETDLVVDELLARGANIMNVLQ